MSGTNSRASNTVWSEGESMVTVRFTEEDGVTTVATLVEYTSKDDRDAAMTTGMTEGMEASYQQLDALLAEEGAAG